MEEMIALKRHFQRERWIEVDMARHEHIYEMSGNPFLSSFASFFIRSTTPTSRRLRKMKW